jgi:hypothetical protein
VLRRAALWIAIAALFVGHGWLSFVFLCDSASFASRWPFLSDDHTLHYASALMTRQFLMDSGTNAGYDPSMMSGYAKSTYWPTNAMLELSMLIFGGWCDPAKVYKTFAWLAAASIPAFVLLAGLSFGLQLGVAASAASLYVFVYWYHHPFHTIEYSKFGMSAFVFSVGWTLLAGGALTRWLRIGGWLPAAFAGLSVGAAAMAHPTAVVLLGPPALVAWLFARPTWKSLGESLSIAFLAIAVNYWWLVPLVALSDSLGRSPSFFNNPNVLERFVDLVRPEPDYASIPAPNFFALLLALTAFRAAYALQGRLKADFLLLLTCAWILTLAIPAGALEALGPLQLGRNTLHLAAWLCIPAASALFHLSSARERWRRIAVWLACGWIGVAALPRFFENVRSIIRLSPVATSAQLHNRYLGLFDSVKSETPVGRRVLFEVFEDRNPLLTNAKNPYASLRLAPLIPMLTDREAIGGPYLSTHYRANFANCGDGSFLAGPWTRARFLAHAGAYAIGSAVLWSPAALKFARDNPDLFERAPNAFNIAVFRIKRPSEAWESAGLEISASPNRIIVRNPRSAKGAFVLPYHYTRGWTATPIVKVSGTLVGEDPTPFLTVSDPPSELTLRFSPWTALWERFAR